MLEIVLKVKDEASAVLAKVGAQAVSAFTKAAAGAKAAFAAARGLSQVVADSLQVIDKVMRSIGKVFEILKKYAPESAEYLAIVSERQEQMIQRIVESINRLKAAGESLLLTIFEQFGGGLIETLDSISVWVAKHKDEIARFIVDVGKWLVVAFTEIGRFLGEMFKKIAKAFGMDTRTELEKSLDAEIEYFALKSVEIQSMRAGMLSNLLTPMSAKEKTDLAFYESEIKRLRALKSELSTQGVFGKPPELPPFTSSPGDIKMGVVRQLSKTEQEKLDVSKKGWEDLDALSKAMQSKSVADSAAYFDKLLEIQQGFIDAQKSTVENGNADLDAASKARMAFIEAEEKNREEAAETAALLDDLRLRQYIEGLNAIAKAQREQMQKIQEEAAQMRAAIASTMTDSVLNAFEAMIRGTMSVAQAFGTMVSSILIDVGRMLAQKQLASFITGLLGSLAGGATSGADNGPGSSNFAARSAPGAGLAWGGPVQSGLGYVVGERGAEMFRPSSSGSVVAPSMSIVVNGANDPVATAREIRNEVLRLATVDSAFRRRLQVT